ncbi:hypothetical protein HFK83_23195 [Ralstonia pseudosolanacearum]|uniref:toxin-antitoxin system YwqK family antitoxin n=1 Tax=Ralstonia pseudosolanacearum TaxID=1310165 RepID=UPI0002D9725E|nr:hypothetical protein [Ralstonia pseudosolanacearum]MCK4125263.1 hypothetical protein [Ralstonia pseudosolanacearum]
MNINLYSTRRVLALCTLATSALLLSACGNRMLDYRNAEIVNGKVYAKGANSPFSGKVTNVPSNAIFMRQDGYQKLLGQAGTLMIGLYGTSVLCDAKVDDGILDGDVACKRAGSNVLQMTAHFDQGAMTGDFAMYNQSGEKPIVEAGFKNGKLDGEVKVYAAETGKLVSRQSLKDGLNEGSFQQWDAKTGNLVLESNYRKGVQDGNYVKSDANGNVLEKGSFSDGKFTGVQTVTVGGLFYKEPVEKQTKDGVVQNQSEIDTAIHSASDVSHCVERLRNEVYERTHNLPTKEELPPLIEQCKQRIASTSTGSPALEAAASQSANREDRYSWPTESNACTERWSAVFTKTHEKDTLVTYDQAWEWVDNCRAGKEPK